jgi:hypothetical protein
MIAGAIIGGAAGKVVKEGIKVAKGTYEKSAMEGVGATGEAGISAGVGEVTGQVAGKVVSKVLSSRVPGFITGATPESRAMTTRAWEGGARPSYASMAPDAKKLQRNEIIARKLGGRYKAQDEANAKYVTDEAARKLAQSGMPKPQLDELTRVMKDDNYSLSARETGELMQKSVQAHIETLKTAVDTTTAAANKQVDTDLSQLDKLITQHAPGALGVDVDEGVRASRERFGKAFSNLYEKILATHGDDPVVPVDAIRAEALSRVQSMPKTTVTALTREMSQLAKKQLAPEDALLLKEFGIELPKAGGISLKNAQRLRSVLREKSIQGALTRNITQGEFSHMQSVVDSAIYEAGIVNPAVAPTVALLKQTDEAYKIGIGKYKDTGVKRLMTALKTAGSGMSPDPAAVAKIITAGNNPARVGEIYKMVGPEVSQRIAAADFSGLIERATVTSELGRTVDGMKLLDAIALRGPKMMEAVHGNNAVTIQEVARTLAARAGKVSPELLQAGSAKTLLGQLRASETALTEYLDKNVLAELANPKRDPEEVYNWIVQPGQESRIMKVSEQFGKDSPQMQAIRQSALESLARDAGIRSILDKGNHALDTALDSYTKKQQELLFPGGRLESLRDLSKVIEFMYPVQSGMAKEEGMAGMTSGQELNYAFWKRNYHIALASLMRFVQLHPTVAKWIVTGRDPNTPWIQAAAKTVKRIVAGATMPTQQSLQDQVNAPAAAGQ